MREACQKCTEMGIDCIRPQLHDPVFAACHSPTMAMPLENMNTPTAVRASNERAELPSIPYVDSFSQEALSLHQPSAVDQGEEISMGMHQANDPLRTTTVHEQIPQGKELKDLIRLYFSSVHRESFGF